MEILPFASLPTEINAAIFNKCKMSDLFQARSVNKLFGAWINSIVANRYQTLSKLEFHALKQKVSKLNHMQFDSTLSRQKNQTLFQLLLLVRLTAYPHLWCTKVEPFLVQKQVNKFERYLDAKNTFLHNFTEFSIKHPEIEKRLSDAHWEFKERLSDITMRWMKVMKISGYASVFDGIRHFGENRLNDVAAIFYKGMRCLKIHGTIERGRQLIATAASCHFAPALFKLGGMYAIGDHVQKDLDLSVVCYEEAIELGNVPAMVNLAYLLMFNQNLKDEKRAFILTKKASQAGLPEAHYVLAYFYINGVHVKKNSDIAWRLYLMAAKKGDRNSKAVLGFLYGDETSWLYDPKKAFKWSLRAAQKGFDPSQAYVGYCYLAGLGVHRNAERSFFWTKKAATTDNPIALNNLGCLFELGIGTKMNTQAAMRYYQLAANLGYPIAEKNLSNLLNRIIEETK